MIKKATTKKPVKQLSEEKQETMKGQISEGTKSLVEETPSPPQQLQVDFVERLTAEDKATLEAVKTKRELALERAKTAIAQNEATEATYNYIILQLAVKYKLIDGDKINEDGTIERNS